MGETAELRLQRRKCGVPPIGAYRRDVDKSLKIPAWETRHRKKDTHPAQISAKLNQHGWTIVVPAIPEHENTTRYLTTTGGVFTVK